MYISAIIAEPAWTVKEEDLLVELRNKRFMLWKDIRTHFLNRYYWLIKEFYKKSELGNWV